MTVENQHVVTAGKLLGTDPGIIDPGFATERAKARALVAIAEELRTANLIALSRDVDGLRDIVLRRLGF